MTAEAPAVIHRPDRSRSDPPTLWTNNYFVATPRRHTPWRRSTRMAKTSAMREWPSDPSPCPKAGISSERSR